MVMFITLIVVMVLQAYAYVQTHQIVYIKYLQGFDYQIYFKKAVKRNQLREIWKI